MANNIISGNRDTVIRTMLAEAGGEGADGLWAVASVMANRAKQTKLTLEQIATQSGQFEPHMTESGRARMARYRPGNALWAAAEQALDKALAGQSNVGEADHFYAPVAQAQATDGRAAIPSWARGRTGSRLGNHVFFSLGYGNRRAAPAGGQVSMPGTSVPATPSAPPRSTAELLAGQRPVTTGRTAEEILGGVLPTENTGPREELKPKAAWAQVTEGLAGPAQERRAVDGVYRGVAENMALAQGAEDRREASVSGLDKFADSVRMNTPLGELSEWVRDNMERGVLNDDPNFNYEAKIEEYEEGRSRREADELRLNANSEAEVIRLRRNQDGDRQRNADLAQNGGVEAFLYMAGGSLTDPIGLSASIATGGVLQAVGVGSRVLAAAGRTGAASASLAVEGAVANGLTLGAMQAAGTYVTPGDYVSALTVGAALNQVSLPFLAADGRRVRATQNLTELNMAVGRAQDAATATEVQVLQEATSRAGPNATPEAIAKAAEEIHYGRATDPLVNTFNPIPEQNRFTSPNHTPSPAKAAELEERTMLVRDPQQRAIIGQYLERGDEIDNLNVHKEASDGLEKWWVSLPSIATSGLTMLRSESPFYRAAAKVLTEGASGHSGRRHTASLDASINEQAFMAPMQGWDANLNLFRKEQGVSMGTRYFDGGAFDRAFNDRVALEMRNRARPDLYAPDSSPAIRRAADMAGEAYRIAGEAQVKWGTVGSQNIKPGDASYFQQSLDPAKVLKMNSENPKLLNEYRLLFREQSEGIFGWDREFADEFSRGYIEVAVRKATGGYQAPANLSSPGAGDIVMETLKNIREKATGVKASRLDDEIAKFGRGGPSFTKKRLDWDMSHAYKSKVTGENIRLLDLASTDMLSMVRQYSRRAAGEIALHKVGIEGRHGADLFRQAAALETARLNTPAAQKELTALDQVLSELLGTEFSKEVRVPALQNLNLITSAIKLGGMAVTQFGETANAMAAIGVQRTLAMVPNMSRLVHEVSAMRKGETIDNGILSSIEKFQGFGFGMRDYILDRALDNKDAGTPLYGNEHIGMVSKASRGAAHLNAIYSGQRIMTSIQTRWMAEEIVGKALRYIREGKNDRALLDMGFTPELQAAIKANMDKIATVEGGKTVKTDLLAGLTEAQAWEVSGAVHRGAAQIIQHAFVGETGAWAHNDVLKSLFQFRTFSLTAVEKQWGRNIQTMGHVKALVTLIGATSIVAPLQIARVYSKAVGMDDEKRKEFLDKNLNPAMIAQASLNYASAAGLLGDIWGVGGAAGSNIMGDAAPSWLNAVANPRGSGKPQQLLGGAVMPSASVLQDAFSVLNGNVSRARSLLPGSNMPAVVPALNVIEGALEDEE